MSSSNASYSLQHRSSDGRYKQVRFQVYNAKNMDSLRQMREHMADRITTLQRRSMSPAIARSDLEILARQQLMRASGQKTDQAML